MHEPEATPVGKWDDAAGGSRSTGRRNLRRSREQFIPLRRARLVELLAEDQALPQDERDQFVRWCERLMSVVHHEYHERLEAIKDDYDPFNPDVATSGEKERTPAAREEAAKRLFANVTSVLKCANYYRLSRDEIEAAAEAASDWGVHLNVDFQVFEHLEVFSRGDVVSTRSRRRWTTGYRHEQVDVPVYERLVVLFQLRDHKRVDGTVDTRAIYLKLFKNIPKQDIDMLLPCTHFQMSWLDHGKVIVPTVSGFLLAVAKGFTAAIGALFTGFWGVLAFLGFVGGTAGYGVKSFLGYLRTKDKYQLNLTRNLYYQNLDNNAGVMFRILDEAEEQECREVILAYALLRRRAG
ncbi:MAG: TMEM143 family protein, partial [Pirellulaceae bacterium]